MPAAGDVDAPDDPAAVDTGPPWLETSTLALLVSSVVLALVPATEVFAPVPWFVGTLLVLLSRRWGVADKAWRCWRSVLGVPFVLLGRDDCRPRRASSCRCCSSASGWRPRPDCCCGPAHRGSRAAACGCADRARPVIRRGAERALRATGTPPAPGRTASGARRRWDADEGGPRGDRPRAEDAGWLRVRSPCHPCRRRPAWPVRPSRACRRRPPRW